MAIYRMLMLEKYYISMINLKLVSGFLFLFICILAPARCSDLFNISFVSPSFETKKSFESDKNSNCLKLNNKDLLDIAYLTACKYYKIDFTDSIEHKSNTNLEYLSKELNFKNSSLSEFIHSLEKVKNLNKTHMGLFVTLSKPNKTRACWGTLSQRHNNLAVETAYSLLGALTKEYRYCPIKSQEINSLNFQITLITNISAISNIHCLNPLRDGLLLRSTGKSAVILPGEAKDSYYQLIMAKLKAGVKPQEHYQLYKLKAEIYD